MVEHRTPNPGAGGSSPSWPAILRDASPLIVKGEAHYFVGRVFGGADRHPHSMTFLGCQARPATRGRIRATMTTKMEKSGKAKKEIEAAEGLNAKFDLARLKQFFADVKSEFGKVVWPNKKQTMGSTGVVVVLVMLISFYLGAVDLLLGKFIGYVLR